MMVQLDQFALAARHGVVARQADVALAGVANMTGVAQAAPCINTKKAEEKTKCITVQQGGISS